VSVVYFSRHLYIILLGIHTSLLIVTAFCRFLHISILVTFPRKQNIDGFSFKQLVQKQSFVSVSPFPRLVR
jgi:hypothetical protein